MSKPPISFRLSERELKLLEFNQRENESLSQTAARLLREKLGITNGPIENLETKSLYRLIDDRFEESLIDVYSYVDKAVNALSERLTALETKPKRTPRSPAKVTE